MNNFIPTPTTQWDKKLKEIYARQDRQFKEHGEREKVVDKQRIAKAKAEDPVKLFTAVTKAFVAGKKAGEKIKDITTDFTKKAWTLKTDVERAIITNKQQAGLDKISEDDINFRNTVLNDLGYVDIDLNKIEELSDDRRQIVDELESFIGQINSTSPSKLARFNTVIGKEKILEHSPSAFAKYLEGQPGIETDAYHKKSPIEQERYYQDWVRENLGDNIVKNDGLWYSTFQPEIERISSTIAGTSRSKKSALLTSDLNINSRNEYIALANNNATGQEFSSAFQRKVIDDINEASTKYIDIKGGFTARQQATNEVVGNLYNLYAAGDLHEDSLSALFKPTPSLAEYSKNAAGGKPVSIDKAFFDKDGAIHNHLLKAVNYAQTNAYQIEENKAETKYQTLYNNIENKTSDEINQEIGELKRLHLKNADTKLALLENIRDNKQDKITANDIIAEYEPYLINGTLHTKLDEINLIKNEIAKKHLQELAGRYKKAYDRNDSAFTKQNNQWGSRFTGTRKNAISNQDAVSSLTPLAGEAYLNLTQFRQRTFRQLVDAQYATGEYVRNDNIFSELNALTNQHWTENDGGKHNEGGIYSTVGHEKEYKNIAIYNNHLAKTDDEHNVKYDIETWAANESKITSAEDYNQTERFKKPEGIYNVNQIIGTLQNGYLNEEMLYIAKKNGFANNPSKLFGYALDSIIADVENNPQSQYKQIVELFNLDRVDTKNQPDQTFADSLDEAVNKTNVDSELYENLIEFKYKLKDKPLKDWTPNELLRAATTLNQYDENELQETEIQTKNEIIRNLSPEEAQAMVDASKNQTKTTDKIEPTIDHKLIANGYKDLSPKQLLARIKEELKLLPEKRSLPAKYYEPFK